MNDWTSGYVAELDYTHDFFHEMTPSRLAFAALSRGHRHGLDDNRLTYCELGCGQGFTANLLAAANPHVDVHAMDFNPAHIAGAHRLAREAAVPNVTFYERSFEDFEEEATLPNSFDVIALHGVYSWVSRENQERIIDFIARRLKPGGLVYISYNTQPGWAPSMPLRRLLTDRAAQGNGSLEQRIDEALDFAERLKLADAGFFASNPGQLTRLSEMKSMSRNYLAHEFFNKDWTPFHFADVADDLAQAKLEFMGAANPLDHIDDICLSRPQQALLAEESNSVRREGLRDILLNEQFRADVFVRGWLPQTQRGGVGGWFQTPFALARHYGTGPLKVNWRKGDIALEASQYEPVLQALSDGHHTVRALLEQGVFSDMTWGDITRMLTILTGAGYIVPCLPQAGYADRIVRCRDFNMAVCKNAEDSERLGFLASPVTGGGVAVDRMEQLFLLAQSEGHQTPNDWATFVWRILEPQGQRLEQEGRVLDLPEENLAVLRARAHAFSARRLGILAGLGVSLLQADPSQPEMAHPTAASSQSGAVA
ncbi:putative methyltransferase [Phaeobacter piscinae]|uniref:Methyltransferase n=1 Tax=Phaeobacter piscinae TaxID=1580596 RepID=A0ABM6PHU3_9RHOB|nr:methyltransferase regulatory domain-containing protein [Phaeobacter piscinae]ATG37202.1 putative methyltransferase [Phaeobacter piscinae]AUQ87723.1 putative methyltransferase [Phaeobacter piscinae]AUR25606.1 putative methyltransferase [Phaeobacter piscinae]